MAGTRATLSTRSSSNLNMPCTKHLFIDLKHFLNNLWINNRFIKNINTRDPMTEQRHRQQWFSPVASGSNAPRAMVICPCSTGTLAAVAQGMANNLIERAADVMLKERRQLILVPRESPYSEIHLTQMLTLTRMGAVILPASPGFYHQPQQIEDLIDFIVARILDHLQLDHQLIRRWSGEERGQDG